MFCFSNFASPDYIPLTHRHRHCNCTTNINLIFTQFFPTFHYSVVWKDFVAVTLLSEWLTVVVQQIVSLLCNSVYCTVLCLSLARLSFHWTSDLLCWKFVYLLPSSAKTYNANNIISNLTSFIIMLDKYCSIFLFTVLLFIHSSDALIITIND